MDIQEIFSVELKSFPYKTTFKTNSNASALLYVAGSCRANQKAGLIGMDVKIDGNIVCTMSVWSNDLGVSRPVVARLVNIPTGFTEHTLELTATTPNTGLGSHDFACGTIIYGGGVEPFLWHFTGPVPKYTTFKSVMFGEAILYLAGSAWLKSPQVCGLSVVLDGETVARTQMLPSVGGYHDAFPPIFVPVKLKPKEYKIGVSTTIGEVLSDENDNYNVGIIY